MLDWDGVVLNYIVSEKREPPAEIGSSVHTATTVSTIWVEKGL